MRIVGVLIRSTLVSIVIFFAISFVTVLLCIGPLHYTRMGDDYSFNIGFPFQYYHQFIVSGNPFPDFGWDVTNLLIDCIITWTIVVAVVYFKRQKNISAQ